MYHIYVSGARDTHSALQRAPHCRDTAPPANPAGQPPPTAAQPMVRRAGKAERGEKSHHQFHFHSFILILLFHYLVFDLHTDRKILSILPLCQDN
ncbi:hypothetical protein AOLI_G00185970 [Acnodon oligacanthus]